MTRSWIAPLALGLVGVLTAAGWADPRPFTFVYDTYPEGQGNLEYEQWVTFEEHTGEDSGYQRLAFREEIEYGVTDWFDLSIYPGNFSYEDSDQRRGTHFDSFAVEGIVYLMNTVNDPFGLALYLETAVGEDSLTFEPKLLVQKDIGNWILAYNLVAETEIEGVFHDDRENEVEGELANYFGASYAVAPGWRIGGEVLVESVFEDWSDYEHTTVYAGPALSYQSGIVPGTDWAWWATATPAMQLTDVAEEPDFVFRMVAGVEF